jgi:hypothetical protein
MSDKSVLLVTIRFKKRIVMTNEFTVRLSSTEFGDQFTIEKLIKEGYKKHINTSLTGKNIMLRLFQRLLGYGKNIGFNSSDVLTVYTEKDKGRIALTDVARHVLVNNEVIVVEYYHRNLVLGTGFVFLAGILYFGFNLRKYIHYRIHKYQQLSIKSF